jgi:hypothetical protein
VKWKRQAKECSRVASGRSSFPSCSCGGQPLKGGREKECRSDWLRNSRYRSDGCMRRNSRMLFFLGTHRPNWLGKVDVPLAVSHHTLGKLKKLPRARCIWGLDSGGFSELSMFGTWKITPQKYVREVRRFSSEIGNLRWAAVQDWMCEPFVLSKTGLSVTEHQKRTIDSYKELCDLVPEIPWLPVLQGYELPDYLRHLDMYESEGIDLVKAPLVGMGSMCWRQHTSEAELILRILAGAGLKLHMFGFKIKGLARVSDALESSDSMAWSFAAPFSPPLPGCAHKSCANCLRFALRWREWILNVISAPKQLWLVDH